MTGILITMPGFYMLFFGRVNGVTCRMMAEVYENEVMIYERERFLSQKKD